MQIRSNVLEQAAAPPHEAVVHFRSRLRYEADCADVAADRRAGVPGLVIVDCRRPELFQAGHVPGAINIPPRRITAQTIEQLVPDEDSLIITYCAGPHCNASTRGALRFAALGRRVKEMPGGMDGWIRERLPVETGRSAGASRAGGGCAH